MPLPAKPLQKLLASISLATLVAASAHAAAPASIAGLSLQLEADSGLTLDGNNDVIS